MKPPSRRTLPIARPEATGEHQADERQDDERQDDERQDEHLAEIIRRWPSLSAEQREIVLFVVLAVVKAAGEN